MILKYFPVIIFLFVTSNAQLQILLDYIVNSKGHKLNEKCCEASGSRAYQHPDVELSVPQMIQRYGYPLEIHTIQTEDNYLLTLHRIPFGKKNKNKKNRKPILLMHGLFESSKDWVHMGPERSLGYLLADLGYDVWMGNARGNTYSRCHKFLDPDVDVDSFWNFSWHEIGVFDLPATIDYILKVTNNKKLFYIGHSQGGTTFFVMTSMRPEYNEKIAVMFGLAPAVFMKNLRSPIVKVSSIYLPYSMQIFERYAKHELLSSFGLIKSLEDWCITSCAMQEMCENILYLITGYDKAQMDRDKLPVVLSNFSSGSSTKQVVHYMQNTRSALNSFRLFDYGIEKNINLYNSIHPPDYPLQRVTTPVALFSSYNDLFADIRDVNKLGLILPNVILNYHVPFEDFTHLDFLWAKDVVPLVYEEVFKQLKKFK